MQLIKSGIGVTTAMLLLCAVHTACAQDTLRITIPDAEKTFLKNNLYTLAAQLNVDAQKAMEMQARLYPNPFVSTELNAFDPENNKIFHVGNSGQKSFGIDQLILLGGKKKNEIALAKLNTRSAELALDSLLRNFRYTLHRSMYTVYFNMRTLRKYDQQLQQLDTLIDAFDSQARKGNVALKDVVRLKSAYIKLNNDKSDLLQDVQEEQRTLQLLLRSGGFVLPSIDENGVAVYEKLLPVDSLLQLAVVNRADIKIAELAISASQANRRFQQSMAVPDLSLGAQYDQQSGAFKNQVNITVGMPLPIFHRNQGNIKAAQTQEKIASLQHDIVRAEVEADIRNTWANMHRSLQEYQKIKQVYSKDFTEVLEGITDNFRKRNISIVEFVDFYESYNETLAEVNRITKQLALSAEAINYAVGVPVYQ